MNEFLQDGWYLLIDKFEYFRALEGFYYKMFQNFSKDILNYLFENMVAVIIIFGLLWWFEEKGLPRFIEDLKLIKKLIK